MGNIGIWQLLIVLFIILLLFGSSRVKTLGADLGQAIKGFRKSIKEGSEDFASHNESSPPKTQHKS